jgi:hypothetical protein
MRPLLSICVLLSVGAAGLTGCATGPELRPAPFRARPDSVDPGTLRGPFSGRVFDGSNKSPIAGALVYATWSFETGSGLLTPAGFHEHVGSTDAAGRYRIPVLDNAPAGVRVTDFVLVIYKRGFVAYRSDRRFTDLGPRLDFAQQDNQIILERWRAELSHARHLRYIGGGTAVAALTGWEAAEAAAELSSGRQPGELRPGQGDGPYIVAAQLLTESDIKARTKYDGSFETGPLSDEPDTASYSSQHFKALGRAETFDIALRMWRLDTGSAQERYEELLEQLPGIEERDEIASRSFRALEGGIKAISFFDGPRGIVVLLTCGQAQCGTADDAVALARIVHDRIKTLAPDAVAPDPIGPPITPGSPTPPPDEPPPAPTTPGLPVPKAGKP